MKDMTSSGGKEHDDTISPTAEDNGSNGAGDRPVTDNGTKNANFSVGGCPSVSKVDYQLPKDPHSPPGPQNGGDQFSDIGINESVEVGHSGPAQGYGLVGEGSGPAGGGLDRNTKT